MLRNPEAEQFFTTLSAHSDVVEKFLVPLKRLGEFKVRGNLKEYAAPYVVTAEIVFCGAAGMDDTFCACVRTTTKSQSQRELSLHLYAGVGEDHTVSCGLATA